MAVETTLTSAKAWHPDVTAILPSEIIPTALVLTTSTVAGNVEGDEPAVRVPFVRSFGPVGFVDEGQPIPESDGVLDEVVVRTGKVAALTTVSREMTMQPTGTTMITDAMTHEIIRKADAAYLANVSDPTGLLNTPKIVDGGTLAADATSGLIDALMSIESAGGKASVILASPDAWATTLKGSTPLFERMTTAPEQMLYGVPVVVSSQMPAKTLLMFDRSAVLSSVGNVNVARSDDAAFNADAVMLRATFRFGWAVAHPERVVKLATA
ncbi:phage major capsid protein [Mobilicoccus sp.]|uniref:phage major capsid protein n=1 Tax=Mobilicoccus sp. TaxID=2034349 RepID=UPI0028A7A07B|nr:phage major capsid protein [Mobilicoccus sp.]